MDLSKVLLVPKATKVEYDGRRLGLPAEELQRRYRAENAGTIFASHDRQLAMRKRVRALIPEAAVVEREALTREAAARAALVIALGGDNHFIFVSHFLDSTPILGINADRVRSHGGLLGVGEIDLERAVDGLRKDEFSILSWTRIGATVDGKPVGLCTSEFYVGENQRTQMTRLALRLDDGPEEEQKSSGLLIATGAGSTGWFGGYDAPFGRDLKFAKWQATEPFPYDHRYRLVSGELAAGSTLAVRSLNDCRGVVAVDALQEIPFPYGSRAEFRISPSPLRVAWV